MTNAEINAFLQELAGKSIEELRRFIDNSSASPESGLVRNYNEAIWGWDVKDDILKFVLTLREYCDRSFEDDEAIEHIKQNYASLNYDDATIIPNETDYDTLLTPGNYVVTTSENAATMDNCPISHPHRLFVMSEAGSTVRFAQFIISNSNNSIYYRTHLTAGWSDWEKIANENYIKNYVKQNYAALNYSDAISIPATDDEYIDYDELVIPGNYVVTTSAKALRLINCPIKTPHRLFVMSEAGSSVRFAQFIISNNNNSIYYRTHLTAGWSDWEKIADESLLKNLYDYDGFLYRLESSSSIPVGSAALGYNTFISQTWDTLLTDYSDEVTKSVISKDSSNTYNIYKYVFTPRDYHKTVFLTAGCHGDEYEGFWSLYRFMRRIYDEGYKYPNLRSLRHNIRFVIIPAWNPWGVQNKNRLQSNGVSPNENINKSVTVGSITYTAFETAEANAIKTVMDTYDGELSAWIDIHTDPLSKNSHLKRGCYGYVIENTPFAKILYGLDKDFKNIIRDDFNFEVNPPLHESSESSTTGIAGYGNYRGVPSALIEMTPDEFSVGGSAETMKLAEEWYGNVIANFICAV